jgi:hypothetical protein
MKLLKAKALVQAAEDGSLYEIDVVDHDNKLWLVPHWYDVPALGLTKPARLIRLDTLKHQPPSGQSRYVVNAPMPTALLSLPTPKQPTFGFEVQEMPELSLPLGKTTRSLN